MTVRDMVTTLQALPRDAMAFFGGLGDLLATAAMGDWTAADEAHIAYGLSSWHPTAGTRAASKVSRQRRNGRRVRYTNGHLEYRDDDPPTLQWTFPAPMGTRAIVGEFSMADVVTIPQPPFHPRGPHVHDGRGGQGRVGSGHTRTGSCRRAWAILQTFLVDVVVRAGGQRRATASGQDIYAISAPLAVEAVHRLLTGQTKTGGVASAGAVFDAPDFLHALSTHISLDLPNSVAAAQRRAS